MLRNDGQKQTAMGYLSDTAGLKTPTDLSLASVSMIYYFKFHSEKVTNNYMVVYLMMFSYSLSFPFESFHFLYMTEASTLAGENVLGSFKREIILSRIVLEKEMKLL